MTTMESRFRPTAIALLCGAIGLATWIVTMASAPRYSYGASEENGNNAFWWILLGAAVIAGFCFSRHAALAGGALGLPPLLLAPWTTPRGDNDGLWVLIIPMLVVFLFVLVFAAGAGGWIRSRVDHTHITSVLRETIRPVMTSLRRYARTFSAGLVAVALTYVAVILWLTRSDDFDLSSLDAGHPDGKGGSLVWPAIVTTAALVALVTFAVACRRAARKIDRNNRR